ncbi:LamG domain-containing protein [Flavobacterium sp. NRK1]|uniref:LamG domain-containing protein n=1 Tax=Flavobacterium sp. NRK1 TaxID=2954929 RepID=UPI0020939768|nr:LamG-like jellyroll fold domain-containing protein [Flavobacterium sp. NRK1]MCO6146818.1 hypothetical protein [Flavobacterium sp. NRK1]
MAISCQNDSISENTEALNNSSSLTAMLKSMAVNETASDNVLDSTSCFKVKLPVKVVVNNLQMDIVSEADFNNVEAVFNADDNDEDSISFVYPVVLENSDYEEVIVNNEQEFDALKDSCAEIFQYIGDNCVTFVFPMTIYSYDSGFQMQDTYIVNNNEELYKAINILGPNEYYSIRYPVSLNVNEGAGVTVNDNNELVDALNNALEGCQQGGCSNPQILVDDLLFYLTFSNGIAKDLKGNEVIVPSDISFTADRNGNQNCAIVFNGTQFLQIHGNTNNSIVQGDAFSVSFWFRMQNVNNNDIEKFFAKGNTDDEGFNIAARDLNASVFKAGTVQLIDTDWKTDVALPVDTQNWHHLTITVDTANTISLYRDGELKASQQFSEADISANILDYYIGDGCKGYMDDLRVYKKALLPDEVQILFELEGDCNTCLE